MVGRPFKFHAVFALLAASCGSVRTSTTSTDGAHGAPDASTDGAVPPPFSCNGVPCEPLLDADTWDSLEHAIFFPGREIAPCCTSDGLCGATTKVAPDKCLPFHAPGAADPACAPFQTAASGRFVGCCASDGTCGGREGPYNQPVGRSAPTENAARDCEPQGVGARSAPAFGGRVGAAFQNNVLALECRRSDA